MNITFTCISFDIRLIWLYLDVDLFSKTDYWTNALLYIVTIATCESTIIIAHVLLTNIGYTYTCYVIKVMMFDPSLAYQSTNSIVQTIVVCLDFCQQYGPMEWTYLIDLVKLYSWTVICRFRKIYLSVNTKFTLKKCSRYWKDDQFKQSAFHIFHEFIKRLNASFIVWRLQTKITTYCLTKLKYKESITIYYEISSPNKEKVDLNILLF